MSKRARKPKSMFMWAAAMPNGEFIGLYRDRSMARKAVYWAAGIYLPATLYRVVVKAVP